MIKIEIVAPKLIPQIKALKDFDKDAAKWLRVRNQTATEDAATVWRGAAPFGTGRYRARITGKVRKISGVNVIGIVGTTASASGYPYPKLLEFSPKARYRSTMRAGQRTARQARKAIASTGKTTAGKMGKQMPKLAKEVVTK